MAAGVLIRSFGEYWSPDYVDWGRKGPGGKGRLQGEYGPSRNRRSVDVWNQRGIYILHDSWEVVYVGKADGTPLGSRVKSHLGDRHAGRWDRFSWYGIIGVVTDGPKKGKLGAEPTTKAVDASDLIATLESFLLAVEPPRNRRREKIPKATEVLQAASEPPRHVASSLVEIRSRLTDIEDAVAEIQEHLKTAD